VPDHIDLASIIDNPTHAVEIPLRDVPAWLATLAIERERLAGLERVLLSRLVVGASTPSGGDRLLSLTEAAALFGKSTTWVRRRSATLPFARKVGRSWRYVAADLERYLGRVRQVG
jgi:hypothetical protein